MDRALWFRCRFLVALEPYSRRDCRFNSCRCPQRVLSRQNLRPSDAAVRVDADPDGQKMALAEFERRRIG